MANFAAGQRVTAQALNDALPVLVGVTTGGFVIPASSSVYTAIQWSAQSSSNSSGMWSPVNPTRLFAPTDGTYALGGFVNWPGTLGANDARGQFAVNGGSAITTAKVDTVRGSSGNITGAISGSVVMTAGQYLEMVLNQNSGASVTVIAALYMSRLSTAIA